MGAVKKVTVINALSSRLSASLKAAVSEKRFFELGLELISKFPLFEDGLLKVTEET
jgi:hypothetical protein